MVGEIIMSGKLEELKNLVKEYEEEINKRVPVEQRLLDSANGSKPLPDKEECLKMARILGRD